MKKGVFTLLIKMRLIDGYLRELSRMHEIHDNYVMLCTKLQDIPFECRRELDQNRVNDARDYREKIAKQYSIKYNSFTPISALEILLSLSDRFAGVLFSPNDPDFDGQEEIFSLFIENLDLLSYDDNNFDEKKVVMKVRRWINLDYNLDGTNGNIVCQPGNRKIKYMDIWMQLNACIYPNFERINPEFPVTHPYT